MTPTAVESSELRGEEAQPRKPLYPKLKPGPGRSTEEVLVNQRARLHSAMIELSAERGYEGVTVRSLARLAGVSTRSFYKHFANAEECFASTYEAVMRYALRRAYAAQRECGNWEEAVLASLHALMEDLARNPKAARLVLVEAFAVDSSMQSPMREAISGFERLLGDSLLADSQAPGPSHHIAGGIAAGVMRVVRTRFLSGPEADLEALAGELGEWVLSLLGGRSGLGELAAPMPSFPRIGTEGGEAVERPAPALLCGVADERRRILSAIVKLAASEGFSSLTVPRVRAEAGVSRRSFDARFADVGKCFLEAIEALSLGAAACADGRAMEADTWEAGVHRATADICMQIARKPLLARLAFIDIFAPGREGLERREHLISLAANRLRSSAPPERRPSMLVAEASAAAAWRVVHTALVTGREKELPRLALLVEYLLLAPAIDASASRSG